LALLVGLPGICQCWLFTAVYNDNKIISYGINVKEILYEVYTAMFIGQLIAKFTK